MPLCTVHLLTLSPTTTLPDFLKALSSALTAPPLTLSRVIRWIIRPTSLHFSTLLDHPWDLLLIVLGKSVLPSSLRNPALIRDLYTLHTGVPSALTSNFSQKNARLLRPKQGDVPALTGSLEKPRMAESAQKLEWTEQLAAWLPIWEENGGISGRGAVSMLNLLRFKEGKHEEYLKYGKAFGERVGKRRGGTAKIVGRVVAGVDTEAEGAGKGKGVEWDEIALAHYPSFRHFADMAASEDYQEANHKWRVDSLQDTCILMTSELDLPSVGGLMAQL